MLHVAVYPCEEFHCLTAAAPDHGIIQDKHFDTFRPGKAAEYAGYFRRKKQELKYFVCRDSAVLSDICLAEQFPKLELLKSIRKLVPGIFILAHLVYHKISISSLYGFDCGDLIIPKIGCCFMSGHQLITLFCLKFLYITSP